MVKKTLHFFFCKAPGKEDFTFFQASGVSSSPGSSELAKGGLQVLLQRMEHITGDQATATGAMQAGEYSSQSKWVVGRRPTLDSPGEQ